jgi:hypothetical protein
MLTVFRVEDRFQLMDHRLVRLAERTERIIVGGDGICVADGCHACSEVIQCEAL